MFLKTLINIYSACICQVISAKEYEVTKTEVNEESSLQNTETSSIKDEDVTDSKQTNHTEDDIYLNDSSVDVQNGTIDLEDDIEVLHVSNGKGQLPNYLDKKIPSS